MRLTNKVSHRVIALGIVASLSACGRGGDDAPALASTDSGASRMPVSGPGADYPVVLGEPYSIDGKLYTPVDTTSYDEVGYAAPDGQGGAGITASHKTLPLPSYVEITSLVTGKTILARVERRGPMTADRLVSLSRGAQAQLGSDDGTPVRVRRVNPPEVERAKLRTGQSVVERTETPQSLVAVLKRKLPERGSANLGSPAAPNPEAGAIAAVAVPASKAAEPAQKAPAFDNTFKPGAASPANYALAPISGPAPAVTPPKTAAAPKPAVEPKPTAAAGNYVVQAAAFSNQASARKVASSLGGFVQPAGKLFRVRVGPFTSRGQADAALAKVRAAGYSDARVSTAG